MAIVGGFVGYKIYLNWKKQTADGQTSVLSVIQFAFTNMDYLVDTLQNVMYSLGDIDPANYETDDEYRKKLIEEAVAIIELKAAESGIKFNLNHTTLVNVADIVIKEVIRRADKSKQEALVSEKVDTKAVDTTGKKDISGELTDFYKE